MRFLEALEVSPSSASIDSLTVRRLLANAACSAEPYQTKWADVDLDDAWRHIPKRGTAAATDIPLARIVVRRSRELRTPAGGSAGALPTHSRGRTARHGRDTDLTKNRLREAIDARREVLGT